MGPVKPSGAVTVDLTLSDSEPEAAAAPIVKKEAADAKSGHGRGKNQQSEKPIACKAAARKAPARRAAAPAKRGNKKTVLEGASMFEKYATPQGCGCLKSG